MLTRVDHIDFKVPDLPAALAFFAALGFVEVRRTPARGSVEVALPGEVVFALLDREPLFLLPQLKARGHAWVGNHAADASGYRLLVRRGGDA